MNLFDYLTGSPSTTGTWTETSSVPSGAPLSGGYLGTIDFTGVSSGSFEFSYSVPGTITCSATSSTMVVNVGDSPNSGVGGEISVCN